MSIGSAGASGRPVCLFAHPSAELFGADRMLLESVIAAADEGFDCVVVLPENGPLVSALRATGARVVISRGLVLRKSLLRPRNWPTLLRSTLRGLGGASRLISRVRPDCVYVNTITIPLWPLVARLRGVPSISHVHEAEASGSPIVNRVLYAPHLAAQRVLVNSAFSLATIVRDLPRLGRDAHVVYNGVVGPPAPSLPPVALTSPMRVLFVGRLSPRKGPDVLLEAARRLRDAGTDVRVELLGSVFPGYEWFEEDLRRFVRQHGLSDRVALLGFRDVIWPVVDGAHVLVVPSTADEPFGNTAVESILALRPVVASDTSGLREAAGDYPTARLVPAGDPGALADALAEIAAGWPTIVSQLRTSAEQAVKRHAPAAYRGQIVAHLAAVRSPDQPLGGRSRSGSSTARVSGR